MPNRCSLKLCVRKFLCEINQPSFCTGRHGLNVKGKKKERKSESREESEESRRADHRRHPRRKERENLLGGGRSVFVLGLFCLVNTPRESARTQCGEQSESGGHHRRRRCRRVPRPPRKIVPRKATVVGKAEKVVVPPECGSYQKRGTSPSSPRLLVPPTHKAPT